MHPLPEYVCVTEVRFWLHVTFYYSTCVLPTCVFQWVVNNTLPQFFTGLGVIPSHWTPKGLCVPSAQDNLSCWRLPSHVLPHLLPTLSKRIMGLCDRSWQDKAMQMWCVNLVRTLLPKQNSVKAEILPETTLKEMGWTTQPQKNPKFCITSLN